MSLTAEVQRRCLRCPTEALLQGPLDSKHRLYAKSPPISAKRFDLPVSQSACSSSATIRPSTRCHRRLANARIWTDSEIDGPALLGNRSHQRAIRRAMRECLGPRVAISAVSALKALLDSNLSY